MAISAVIALGAATLDTSQSKGTSVTCTVTNSGTASVNVTGIQTICTPTGGTRQDVAAMLGAPPLGPGMAIAVAGSNGTLAIVWGVTPYAPTSGYGLAAPSQYLYDIGAIIYTSDGAVTAATVATLTVNSPSHN